MDYFDYINEYLNNTLADSDRVAFEAAMKTDLKLKQAVDDHGAAMDVLGSILEGEVRKVIGNEEGIINNGEVRNNGANGKLKIENRKLEDSRKDKNKGTKVKRMDWVRWASAAVVVFVLGWWGMNQFDNNGNSKLYTQLYSDAAWPMDRGSDSNELTKSIVKYFEGEEELAKKELKSISSLESRYWLSEIYFKEMKSDSTLMFLPKENISDEINKRDRINYLKILSLYFKGDKDAAEKELKELPSDTDVYYTQIFSKLSF